MNKRRRQAGATDEWSLESPARSRRRVSSSHLSGNGACDLPKTCRVAVVTALESQSGCSCLLLAAPASDSLAVRSHDAPTFVLHENDVAVDFFTGCFLLGVVEPHGQRVARAVVIDSYFVHKSVPFFNWRVSTPQGQGAACGGGALAGSGVPADVVTAPGSSAGMAG